MRGLKHDALQFSTTTPSATNTYVPPFLQGRVSPTTDRATKHLLQRTPVHARTTPEALTFRRSLSLCTRSASAAFLTILGTCRCFTIRRTSGMCSYLPSAGKSQDVVKM